MAAGFEPTEDLRSGLHVAGSAGGRRRSRRGAGHHLEAEVWLGERAESRAGRDQARDRVWDLPERTVSSHLPVLRVQRGRVAPEGVRRRDGARGGQRPRELQPSLRAAVARRASVPELLLPDRHLSVRRHPAARSGNRRARRSADARHEAAVSAARVLHEFVLRILGPRRLARPHHDRRPGGRAAAGQRARLSAHRRSARRRGLPALAHDRPADEQPARLPVGHAHAARLDEPLDHGRSRAAAGRLPTARQGHARLARQVEIPEGPFGERPPDTAQGLSRRLRSGLHRQGHRLAGAAEDRLRLSDPGSAGRRGWE